MYAKDKFITSKEEFVMKVINNGIDELYRSRTIR